MKDQPIRVLIIEDNPADYRLIEEGLADCHTAAIDIQHADTLQSGIERLVGGSIDVLLLDLNLRVSGGLDTLSRVQQSAPSTPIVVMTGIEDEEMAREAVRRGAQDYLVKGQGDGNLLTRSVVYALERSRAEQRRRESEARLRVLTHQVPATLWSTDRQLRVLSAVGKSRRLLNLDLSDSARPTIQEVFAPATRGPIQFHEKALEGSTASGTFELGGNWFQCYVEPLHDSEGQVNGTIGVALDITEQRRLERSVQAAKRIQEHLLPKQAPEVAGYDIAGACFPAESCSGDYFDFFRLGDGKVSIVVADAVGHGFGPAILAATVRSYLRAAAMQHREIHEMLTMVNWLLANDSAPDQYVTMFCCCLDAENSAFNFASAGHVGYLIDANGRANMLRSGCMPLGIEPNETFHLSNKFSLHPGDILFLCTDGMLETRSTADKEFGERATLDIIKENRDLSAEEIIRTLYESVKRFAKDSKPQDDVTAVIVKVESSN